MPEASTAYTLRAPAYTTTPKLIIMALPVDGLQVPIRAGAHTMLSCGLLKQAYILLAAASYSYVLCSGRRATK